MKSSNRRCYRPLQPKEVRPWSLTQNHGDRRQIVRPWTTRNHRIKFTRNSLLNHRKHLEIISKTNESHKIPWKNRTKRKVLRRLPRNFANPPSIYRAEPESIDSRLWYYVNVHKSTHNCERNEMNKNLNLREREREHCVKISGKKENEFALIFRGF